MTPETRDARDRMLLLEVCRSGKAETVSSTCLVRIGMCLDLDRLPPAMNGHTRSFIVRSGC